jgi:hypothetical protein
MASHPNFDRVQAALDASRQGDYGPSFDLFADDILLKTAPAPGPGTEPEARTT